MSDFPKEAKVVIIGGGAVGASSLYHLAKAWQTLRGPAHQALERRCAKGARHHTSSHTVPLREALTRTSAASLTL